MAGKYRPPSADEPSFERPPRPLGVPIMCTTNIILAGTVPLIRTFFQSQGNFFLLPAVTRLVGVALPILILWASWSTWSGRDRGRTALLYLLTIYYAIQIFSYVIILQTGILDSTTTLVTILSILFAIAWVGFNWWYFLRPATLIYYRRPKKSPPSN
ncbi:MAG TPA: hypothetical protein VLL52_01155 [Anaerolineae bacterium]|nr:hypothetical protein [Anaerolineae bacterium]